MPVSVYLLGLTIFALGTSEFMVAGMMPSLAQALDVSLPQVGHLISIYAAGIVVGGPVLTAILLAWHVPNKLALLGLMAVYAAAQSMAAMAHTQGLMAGARLVTGIVAAACFGAALALCADMVAPQQRGRAAAAVLGGLMLAAVLGVPLATLIDQHWGWRTSFWLVVVLVVVCAASVAIWVPASRSTPHGGLGQELQEFRNPHLWMAYLTSALIIGSAFAAFSYFAVILTGLPGWPAAAVPWLLATYGVANMVGNIVVGRHADRHTHAVLAIGLTVLMAALALFAWQAECAALSVVMVVVTGLTGVTLNPAMAARVMRVARPGPLVNTMHASVINIGLGVGTWLGGEAIDKGYGLRSPLWIGAALAALGLASLLPYASRGRRAQAMACRG